MRKILIYHFKNFSVMVEVDFPFKFHMFVDTFEINIRSLLRVLALSFLSLTIVKRNVLSAKSFTFDLLLSGYQLQTYMPCFNEVFNKVQKQLPSGVL